MSRVGGLIALPSQAELHRLLDYNPQTGDFIWKRRGEHGWDRQWAGKPALACVYNGYRVGCLLGRRSVAAHRVAFKYVHGCDPRGEVDHINGNRADNRIENLRDATVLDQRRNAAMPCTNTTGHVGVYFRRDRRKWKAQIGQFNRTVNLGHFETKEEAIAAREAAERKLGFHRNHGRPA